MQEGGAVVGLRREKRVVESEPYPKARRWGRAG